MSAPIEAASVLLVRDGREVLLVQRALNLRFMGGFVAFPGGKIHADDATLARPAAGLTARHVAAVRELFEETGVLLARLTQGYLVTPDPLLSELRRGLLEETISLAAVLARLDAHLDAADLIPAGRLITPPFAPLRFDTEFYIAHLPRGQVAEVWPGELTSCRWETPERSLREWQTASLLLSPPTVTILQAVADGRIDHLPERLSPLLAELDAGLIPPILFAPDVLMIPLHCQGLPPTTHTNAFLVGNGPVSLIDPGPVSEEEQEKLFRVLDQQASSGRKLDRIILTHHHPDHIGAANVCAQRYSVPILAHPVTADLVKDRISVTGFIEDGQRLELGRCPADGSPWSLEAIHTPGHAAGHLVFHDNYYGLLFAGDMVSTISSIIIAPPEGDLKVYLGSLERLKAMDFRLLLPSHGGGSARPREVIEEAIEHRRRRNQQLLDALAGGPRTMDELMAEIYRGLPAQSRKLGELQLEASLIMLRGMGLIERREDRWQRNG